MELSIDQLTELLSQKVSELSNVDDKIDTLNKIKLSLNEVSPLKHHPVDCVLWEKSENIEINSYNPNRMFEPESKLLYQSVKNDGYTMPVVSFKSESTIFIVDGQHRRMCERDNKDISESTFGRIPLTNIRGSQSDQSNRMASTIRHNRARGSHSVELMSNIVGELVTAGMSDAWILKHIGMDKDELLRLKQITGLASLFSTQEFSESWDSKEVISDMESIEMDTEYGE